MNDWERERGIVTVQEVIVSAESEERVNALNESAFENWPSTAEERDHNQSCHQSMANQ